MEDLNDYDAANYVFVLNDSPFESKLDNAQTSLLARDVLNGRASRFARVAFDPNDTDIASVLSTTATGFCRPSSPLPVLAEQLVVPENRKIASASLLCEHASAGSVSPPPVNCNTGATTLMDVKSPQQLCEMLVHVAVGWLHNYQSGIIHRDITVWNVLVLDGPTEDLLFTSKLDIIRTNWPPVELVSKARKLVQTSSKPIPDMDTSRYPIIWGIPNIRDVEREASRVETLVKLLDISTSSQTFFTDSVMSMMWTEGILEDRNLDSRCGPQDFMSRHLYARLLGSSPYLKHCVDDVDSLYWLAQWVSVLTGSEAESVLTARLRSNARQPEYRYVATQMIRDIIPAKLGYDPMLLKMKPVLVALNGSMRTLHSDWATHVELVAPLLDNGEERAAFYLPWFHFFAYRSIAMFSQAFHEHGCQPQALKANDPRPSTLQSLILTIVFLAGFLPFSSFWLPFFDFQGIDAEIGQCL